MSIYKNQTTDQSLKQLGKTTEAGLYTAFGVQGGFVVSLVRGFFFLIIGSIALPLRVTTRTMIGERSVDFVRLVIGMAFMIMVGLYGFTFSFLSSEPVAPYYKDIHPRLEDSSSVAEHREAVLEYRAYLRSKWEIQNLVEDYFPHGSSPVLIYTILCYCMLMLYQHQVRKYEFVKRHSQYRGRTIMHALFPNEEDEINWVRDAFFMFFVPWLLVIILDSPSLFFLLLIQSVALIIEEIAVKKRKRYAVLDINEAEIESKMINTYRAKFSEISSGGTTTRRADIIEDVELA